MYIYNLINISLSSATSPANTNLRHYTQILSSTTSGTYEDCSALLLNHEKNAWVGIWEFNEFAKEWRAMRFELIFSGRQYMAELAKFCRSLTNTDKSSIFNPENSITRRIGAFFI